MSTLISVNDALVLATLQQSADRSGFVLRRIPKRIWRAYNHQTRFETLAQLASISGSERIFRFLLRYAFGKAEYHTAWVSRDRYNLHQYHSIIACAKANDALISPYGDQAFCVILEQNF
jgi:hypothetical protein